MAFDGRALPQILQREVSWDGKTWKKAVQLENSCLRMTEPRIVGRVLFPLAEDISNEKSNHVSHCIELRIWNPAVDDVCFTGQCVLVERPARRTLGSRRFTAINIGPSDFDPGVFFLSAVDRRCNLSFNSHQAAPCNISLLRGSTSVRGFRCRRAQRDAGCRAGWRHGSQNLAMVYLVPRSWGECRCNPG